MNETITSANQTAPKTFDILDGNTLMAQEYEPLQFAVEKILPHGVYILAGSGKIGKSWLSLDICVNVATGGKLWEFSSEQGDVLYLALEDNYPRLQDRLNKIKATAIDISRLKLTTASFGINSGLLEQTSHHLASFPDTKLIIIDTLERVRDTEFDKNIYACDYRDMTMLRSITDRHKLTLLLIHHTRKLHDDDPLNTLSGSMGLVGSVDGVFVLEKEKRTGLDAKLTIANRDTATPRGFVSCCGLTPTTASGRSSVIIMNWKKSKKKKQTKKTSCFSFWWMIFSKMSGAERLRNYATL
jgi:RecA-family ATPase